MLQDFPPKILKFVIPFFLFQAIAESFTYDASKSDKCVTNLHNSIHSDSSLITWRNYLHIFDELSKFGEKEFAGTTELACGGS